MIMAYVSDNAVFTIFFFYTGWDNDILHRMTKTCDCIKCNHRLQWCLILMKFHCLSMATSNFAMGNFFHIS